MVDQEHLKDQAVKPEKFAALYFSGTGNTKFALNTFVRALGMDAKSVFSIEEGEEQIERALQKADTVIIAYPNYMCVIPKIMSDYLKEHGRWFAGKSIITLITFAMFSFDTGLQGFRLLRKAKIPFVEQSNISVQMPMNVGDMKLMKPTDEETQKKLIEDVPIKLERCAKAILAGGHIRDGRPSQRPLAFLRQRMYYQGRMKKDYAGMKFRDTCICCGICVECCPKDNLAIEGDHIVQKGVCTQCYRCVNLCPTQTITIWGQEVHWQYEFDEHTGAGRLRIY